MLGTVLDTNDTASHEASYLIGYLIIWQLSNDGIHQKEIPNYYWYCYVWIFILGSFFFTMSLCVVNYTYHL